MAHREPSPASLPHGAPGHITRAKDPFIVLGGQKPIDMIGKAFVILAMAILAFMSISAIQEWREQKVAERTAQRARMANTPAPPPRVVVQKVDPKPEEYLWDEHPSGCVTLKLGYKARWYPLGGAMQITAPDGSKRVERPGEKVPLSKFGPGMWQFCRHEPQATGVHIWQ